MSLTINKCSQCGGESEVISFYIKGTPNRLHYFVKCIECGKRQINEYKKMSKAIDLWNGCNESNKEE